MSSQSSSVTLPSSRFRAEGGPKGILWIVKNGIVDVLSTIHAPSGSTYMEDECYVVLDSLRTRDRVAVLII